MSLYADHLFPRLLDLLSRALEPDRAAVIGRARGRVLELGFGTGANLPHYGAGVTEVVGIEPGTGMTHRTRQRIAQLQAAGRPVPDFDLHQGSAEALPFRDQSFDTVVAFLVLCTIPDAATALHEARRVLRPGGRLLFFEHVRAPEPQLARWQDRIDPVWTRIACGCHLNRDTRALIDGSGFSFHDLEAAHHPRMGPKLSNFVIQGQAVAG